MIRLGYKKAKTTTATFHSYVATEAHKNELQSEMEKKLEKNMNKVLKAHAYDIDIKAVIFFLVVSS